MAATVMVSLMGKAFTRGLMAKFTMENGKMVLNMAMEFGEELEESLT